MNCLANNSKQCGSGTPEPHFIPGYKGYLPQNKYRAGHTYGMTSNNVLSDPCVQKSPRSVLGNMAPGNCSDEFGRPPVGMDPYIVSKMDRVNLQSSGQTGLSQNEVIPRFQNLLGHTYSPACNRGLIRFDQDLWRDKLFTKEITALDQWKDCYSPKPWEIAQRAAVVDNASQACPCSGESTWSGDMGCSGSGGCACNSSGARGGGGSGCKTISILTKERPMCDYGERRIWGLQMANRLNQPCGESNIIRINPNEYCRPLNRIQQVYHDCEGMIPCYGGHVPGEQFRIGKTYGTSTRNAKRGIKPDLLGPLCTQGSKTNYGF